MRTLADVVRIDTDVLTVVGAIAGVAALVLAFLLWRARRGLVRRVVSAALRLEDSPPATEHRGLDRNLGRLERAIDRAALREHDRDLAEARMVQAVESIPQGVVVCDETGHVVFRNRVAAELVPGRRADAIVAAAVEELLAGALRGGRQNRTVELFGPPRRTLVVAGYPLDGDRRTVGALVMIDDITDRRRLEAVRRDFVANISHELKTPVGALGLLAETLLDEDDVEVARRLADRMLAEALRVGRTIDDLLALSRIEAEEPFQREPVAVHLVVAEAVERVRPAAEQRGASIEVMEAPRHLDVIGDRRQLVSALHNLLDNATKYSDAGETVSIGVRHVGDRIDIEVRDRGIGIPARDLDRIFERFYRVDRARSRDTGGTGLGLAIVRHVAANHSGDVRVESREGEGSTFTLSLPAGPGASAAPVAEAG